MHATFKIFFGPASIFAIIAIIAIMVYCGILSLNNGVFIYTLDDPYIHLSIAENIKNFHYGINLDEVSAAASSIIWPFLLALLGTGELAPLLLNACFAIASIFVFALFAARLKVGDTLGALLIRATITLLLIIICNLVGLTFLGMEHCLQVFVVSLIALGLVVEDSEKRAPTWLWIAIIIAPLVRYDTAGISLAALAYLFFRGYYIKSVSTGVAIILCLAAFSGFLYANGLHFLPSSITSKSDTGSNGISGFVHHLLNALRDHRGTNLVVILIVAAGISLSSKSSSSKRLLGAAAILAITVHLLAGQFGWNNRYEIYIYCFAFMVAIYLLASKLDVSHSATSIKSSTKVSVLMVIAVLLLCNRYVTAIPRIPLLSNNIYEQHYQMHRFAIDFYRKPIAVNDIGLVAYKNPYHVLDLWGLGNHRVAEMKANKVQHWPNLLALEKDVEFAMIYKSAFDKHLPKNWQAVAELSLSRELISAAGAVVTFYALSEQAAVDIAPLLTDFKKSLPPRIKFEILKSVTDKVN